MNRKLVYLASPYTSEFESVKEMRFEQACEAAARLMNSGYHVFSPIAHCHPIAKAGLLPTDWPFWMDYDKRMIDACDKLVVLCIDGWQESQGVQAEIDIAKRLGKDVDYVYP